MKKTVLTIIASFGLLFQSFGTVIYVNPQASGANDGTSWANAFTSLSAAIDEATNNSSSVDSLFIAEGTYTTPANSNLGYPVFVCPPQIEMYGGFPSTGNPSISDRDWLAHPTILDGDVSGDDDGTVFTRADNAKRVLLMDTYGVLDGLVVRNGGDNSGAVGAGLTINGANSRSVLVQNCLFENNWVTDAGGLAGQGGAIRGLAINTTDVAELRNSAFINNKAQFGAAFIYSGTGKIENCVFMQNEAELGSAIAISSTGNNENGDGTIINSVFYDNYTTGGVNQGDRSGVIGRLNGGTGEITVWNSTFKDNDADSVSIVYGGIPLETPVQTTFNNCLFDEDNTIPPFKIYQSDFLSINNCVGSFTEGWASTTTVIINEGNLALTNWHEGEPIVYSINNTTDGIFVLDCESPGFDDGLNSLLPTELANGTDLLGNPRVQGNSVDVGAYETAAFAQPVITQQGNTLEATNGPFDNYQWVLDGAALSGETNATLNITANGDYVLVASNDNACGTDSSAVLQVTDQNTTSINNQAQESVKIWPNPAVDVVQIQSAKNIEGVALYNVTGMQQQIGIKPNNAIDLETLAPGVYFLEVQLEVGKSVHRLIKK